ASVYANSYGYGDLDLGASGMIGPNPVPMKYTDQMRIASLTKTFTVTRILQLAADGLISLDDPITAFDGVGGISLANLNYDTSAFGDMSQITVRDLARMTSSLADYSNSPGMIAGLQESLTTVYTESELLDFARGLPATPSTWTYSNTNTLLLGMIVEAVTGNTLGEELQSHVIEPAGLSSNTYYPTDISFTGDHAHGYADDGEEMFEDVTDTSPSIAAGAGAMISTFEDMQIWAEVLATGVLPDGTSLYGEGNEYMQALRLEMVAADGSGPEYDFYGLGIGEIEEWLGHSGEFLGYQHIIMVDPETGRMVVIMINTADLEEGAHLPTDLFRDIAQYYANVPEPSTWALIAATGVAVVLLKRRRRR
ncbi:MAG: serine hydrolase domain-containing protein, partial [Puniceicoccales bacterium]